MIIIGKVALTQSIYCCEQGVTSWQVGHFIDNNLFRSFSRPTRDNFDQKMSTLGLELVRFAININVSLFIGHFEEK